MGCMLAYRARCPMCTAKGLTDCHGRCKSGWAGSCGWCMVKSVVIVAPTEWRARSRWLTGPKLCLCESSPSTPPSGGTFVVERFIGRQESHHLNLHVGVLVENSVHQGKLPAQQVYLGVNFTLACHKFKHKLLGSLGRTWPHRIGNGSLQGLQVLGTTLADLRAI